jgi:hypothetical protein
MNCIFGFSALACWVLSVVITGCSGNPNSVSNAAAGNASTSTNQGASGSTSGGAGGVGNVTWGSAGLGASGGTNNGGTSRYGHFTLLSVHDYSGSFAQASAAFYTTTSQPCSSQAFGDCVLSATCSSSVNYVSAGTLTVTSPATSTLPANNVTMVPNADNTYTAGGLSGAFSGGESAHIAASGANVPAFSEDLTVPLALLIDSPTPDSQGIIQASTSSDLVIQFSRGTTGVELYVQNADGMFECHSAPGASSLTIPKNALGSGATLSLFTLEVTKLLLETSPSLLAFS